LIRQHGPQRVAFVDAAHRLELRHQPLHLGVKRQGLARGDQPVALAREQHIAEL
jgi:hypothetical protein